MVATPLPMLPSWRTPSGSGRSGGSSATAAGVSRASRRTSRATRRSTAGRYRRTPPSGRRRSSVRAATRAASCRARGARARRGGPGGADRGTRPSARPGSRRDEGRGLARSGVIFAVATGVSRVIGLVREIARRDLFGIKGPINAFKIAFLIPNTVRSLVADSALSAAFVPVFSDLLVKGERQARVASGLVDLLADAARPRRPHGALHRDRTVGDGLFGYGPNDLYGPLAIGLAASCSRSSSFSG